MFSERLKCRHKLLKFNSGKISHFETLFWIPGYNIENQYSSDKSMKYGYPIPYSNIFF